MTADEAIDDEVSQSALVHERLKESPYKRWLLLDGNRYVLTVVFSLFVFVVTAFVGFTGFIPVTDPGTATTLVAAIVGGTLPFITIVLAINQLVLSQELGWTSTLQERFDGMQSFRREVEHSTNTAVSPAAPADFLQLVVDNTVEKAQALLAAQGEPGDPDFGAALNEFVDAIMNEGNAVSEALETADFGTFDALSALLGHFNGAHLYAARTIRAQYSEELTEEATRILDNLIELLGQVAITRQTFKTLYMQYELAHLSKVLMYVGFPTLLGGGLFMMSYGPITEAVGDPRVLVLIVSAVVTLVFLPFIVLLVYTFRIASIASRTADFGPFVPRVEFED